MLKRERTGWEPIPWLFFVLSGASAFLMKTLVSGRRRYHMQQPTSAQLGGTNSTTFLDFLETCVHKYRSTRQTSVLLLSSSNRRWIEACLVTSRCVEVFFPAMKMCWASESDFIEAETALTRKLTDHVELCTLGISVLRSLLRFLASSALRFLASSALRFWLVCFAFSGAFQLHAYTCLDSTSA